ncbi:MAG: relaxase/mobilization nuclease domain-containing protein [Bacteroidales bacterium]|jgi:hypothetical protein|nr:relaxase/mobilization nuclease domain-containing protein [Bacteroidales bacterium]
MIIKQIKGEDFLPLCLYQTNKIEMGEAEIIETNMLGKDAHSLAREFDMSTSLRPNVTRIVYHGSISLPPDENLTNDQFKEIGTEFLEKMGFDNNQYFIVRHYDSEHPHIHIITSRIKLDGKIVSDKWDFRRAEKLAREFEVRYGLKQIKNSNEVERKALSKGIVENFKRTGKIPSKIQLQEIVSDSIENSKSTNEFITNINKHGANVVFHHSENRIFGVSFELEGVAFKASQLGKSFSWNQLKNKINYEHEREFKSIIETNGRGAQKDSRGPSESIADYKSSKYRRFEKPANPDSRTNGKYSKFSKERDIASKRQADRFSDLNKSSREDHRGSTKSTEQIDKNETKSGIQNLLNSISHRSGFEPGNVLATLHNGTGLTGNASEMDSLEHEQNREKMKKRKKRKPRISN